MATRPTTVIFARYHSRMVRSSLPHVLPPHGTPVPISRQSHGTSAEEESPTGAGKALGAARAVPAISGMWAPALRCPHAHQPFHRRSRAHLIVSTTMSPSRLHSAPWRGSPPSRTFPWHRCPPTSWSIPTLAADHSNGCRPRRPSIGSDRDTACAPTLVLFSSWGASLLALAATDSGLRTLSENARPPRLPARL